MEQMKNYFDNMARGNVDPSNMYIINQKGRGVGRGRRGKAMYRIPSGTTMVSPVQQAIDQAKQKVSIKGLTGLGKRHSASRGRVGKRSKGGTKRKKTKRKKTKKRSIGTRKGGKRRGKKKASKDIFG